MNKSERIIDMTLQEGGCSMISPGYRYTRDESGIVRGKIDRNLDNLKNLENTISKRMKELYEKNLAEVLEKEIPIIYLDCNKKGNDDIMFFLFKECMKKSTIENKEKVTSQIIGRRTIVSSSPEIRNQHIQENQLDLEGIFGYYNQQLATHLNTNNPNYIKSLLNYEGDIAFDGLLKFMEHEKTRYMYLYLDNVESLSADEQRRINRLLYSRGAIDTDKWIRLKINNGNQGRKTRSSDTGHRVEATHDYSEKNIYEEDVRTIIV